MSRPRTNRPSRLLLACALLLLPTVALAHKQGVHLAIGPVFGNPSSIQITKAGVLVARPFGGGRMVFNLRALRNLAGLEITAPSNQPRLGLRVNGVPTTTVLPFEIRDGKATVRSTLTPGTNLVQGDRIEVTSVDLHDQDGIRFGTFGVPSGTRSPILASSLIYAAESTSVVRFSKGGDTRLKLRDDGNSNSGFDTLVDAAGHRITHPGVTVELGLVRNGVPSTFSYTYDIVNGRSVPDGRPVAQVGLGMTETVEITRLDVFDNTHVRFATLGMKVVAPKAP
ncbi:MAG: hypothetical protein FJ148_18505 [Deltaproteobacteria bacterium]|nr:hypothetical protein [Deltaproteobacteria bacterium]